MALLAAASLGAAQEATDPTRCTVRTEMGESIVERARCDELARLRDEREQLRQYLSELGAPLPRMDPESATGGSGEEGQGEAPGLSEATEAVPPVGEHAVTEEIRALRREVEELRRAVKEGEARAVPPAEAVRGVREEEVRAPQLPSEREEALELLRNTEALSVQNADPAEKQVLGEVNVANRTQEGEAGFLLQPGVRVGTAWNVEFGANAQVRNLAGEAERTTGAVSGYALGQLVEEKRAVPQVSLRGQVTSPQGDEGLSAEVRVLATKTFGQTRLHGNVAYSARQDMEDDYLLGLAADRPIGDRLLLQGDAYYVNPLGAEDASVNASVGTGVRVGRSFVVTGAVGVNARTDDVAPRLLFGVLGRI
jgi:hypothetical protein